MSQSEEESYHRTFSLKLLKNFWSSVLSFKFGKNLSALGKAQRYPEIKTISFSGQEIMTKTMKKQCPGLIHLYPPNLSEALIFCKKQKRFVSTNNHTTYPCASMF